MGLIQTGGIYKTSRAAWAYMMEQKYGRIINTASAVGLYGNFGQTNYSTAKAATVGFSNTLAQEGAKFNIIVSTLAPNAGTRMTATVMPPEMVEALKPEYVAPLVAYLAHDTNRTTGGVYECGAGWISRVRWQRSGGYGFPVNEPLMPEQVKSKMSVINNFEDGRATYPLTPQDSITQVLNNVNAKGGLGDGGKSVKGAPGAAIKGSAPTTIDLEAAKKLDLPPAKYDYTERDLILYNLGLGAKRTDLDLVYENASDFKVLPTFGVIPAFPSMMNFPFGQVLPKFNPMMLLHGEQYLELRSPFPTSGSLETTSKILDIQDKGKGVTVVLATTTRDTKTGKDICYNESTTFIRGVPGQGASKTTQDRGAATAVNTPPVRKPDAVVTEKTTEEQAAIYRLSGDYNPLHIDPNMSKMGGFDVPILHGLCTFGIAGKHVLKQYGNMDPSSMSSMKARFVKHVFPGETLETSMWKEGNTVFFQVKVLERNELVISNAAVVLGGPSKSVKTEASMDVEGFKSSKVFQQIKANMDARSKEERKKQVASVNGVFCMDVTNSEGKQAAWFIDLKSGEGAVGPGKPPKADLTISIADDDFVSLATGKLNPQKAFTSGKLKVKGNIMLGTFTRRLLTIFKRQNLVPCWGAVPNCRLCNTCFCHPLPSWTTSDTCTGSHCLSSLTSAHRSYKEKSSRNMTEEVQKLTEKVEEIVLGPDGQPLSQKAIKKLQVNHFITINSTQKEQEKEKRKREVAEKLAAEKAAREANEVDYSPGKYGKLPLNQSQTRSSTLFTQKTNVKMANEHKYQE